MVGMIGGDCVLVVHYKQGARGRERGIEKREEERGCSEVNEESIRVGI